MTVAILLILNCKLQLQIRIKILYAKFEIRKLAISLVDNKKALKLEQIRKMMSAWELKYFVELCC